MADIANPVNVSTPQKAVTGEITVTESPDPVLLSPGVKEAMDRIFPKSATQLLQRELSFEDHFLGMKAGEENLHFSIQHSPTSCAVSAITLPCTMSTAPVTTTVTTNSAMAAAPEFVTSNAVSGSPVISLSPYMSTGTKQVLQADKREGEDKSSDVGPNSCTTDQQKKALSKIRISKADFEIITSCDILHDESHEKVSRRINSMDVSSGECHSRDESDSDDMRKPFATVAREKKKYKKRKKKQEPNSEKTKVFLCENNTKSVKLSKSEIKYDTESSVSLSDGGSIVSHADFVSRKKKSKQNSRQDSPSFHNLANDNSLMFDQDNIDGGSQNCILKNGSLSKKACYKDSGVTSEEFSDISYSSTKENVQNGRRKPRQNLPATKRNHFNVVKHKNKIRNTFPPCFVVIKKVDVLPVYDVMKDFSVTESVLPLSERVKDLSDLCDRGLITCKKKKKTWVAEEIVYKNIFEETVLPGISDDELDNFRSRRSLRKRDKYVSYVEPSEDDIFDECSRKRPRTKHKDSAGKSEDEGPGENKKRKKQSTSESKAVSCNKERNNDKNSLLEDSAKVTDNKAKIAEKDIAKGSAKDSKKIAPNEVIVYPPSNLSDSISHHLRAERRDILDSRLAEKSKYISSLNENERSMIIPPPSASISVLPTNTLPGTFIRHPNPVPIFPSLPLGFPAGLTPQSLVAGVPISTHTSAADGIHKPPQYCVVKMDGNDVLLQLVPSRGIGLPMPVVMPKEKAMFVPPVPLLPGPTHLFGQPLRPAMSGLSSTPVVSSSQGNSVSASSIPSLFGIPVINRPVNSGSQNISLSALPVIPPAQLAGLTSTANIRTINLSTVALSSATNIRPINLTAPTLSSTRPVTLSSTGLASTVSVRPFNLSPSSLTSAANAGPINLTIRGKQISQRLGAAQTPPVTEISSIAPGVGTAIRCVISSAAASQALPVALTTVTAPNTTTVVQSVHTSGQNLQSMVPGQSNSVRPSRIFVTGSTVTGTHGQFTTFGSSPLTRLSASSELLPQRKCSSDQEISPEERAARRRKLEKKYPLPPGVVIKTEPLDSMPKSSPLITSVAGSRSLLPQNIHLLSASRSGTGVSSIRIISPSLASALSARNMSANSNIIYRAASVGGRQAIVLPSSLGHAINRINTTSTSLTTSLLSASSAAAFVETATATTTFTNTVTTCTNSASATTFLHSISTTTSEGNPSTPAASSAPKFNNTENNSTDKSQSTSGITSEMLTTESTPAEVSSCQVALTANGAVKYTFSSPHNLTSVPELCSSMTPVVVNSEADSNTEQPQERTQPEAATLETVRADFENLRKMVQIQEKRGLKGERLEKLKQLLHRKEERYKEIQKLLSANMPPASGVNGSITGVVVGDNGGEISVSMDGLGSSETDPFVID